MARLAVRAVRGATSVTRDEPALIRAAVQELLDKLLEENDVAVVDVVSAIFTATTDLLSEFPAHGARLHGWTGVPLLCAQELSVHGALPRCLRVLLHVETIRARNEMKHVYLHEAILLRQDLRSD
ncbi:MAG TPA: chorismate mutase [Gemmatimonadaceae bacterium]|nr:chorismate mutase [Gemmatimonadaceae bacterium]